MPNIDLINQRNKAIYARYCELFFGSMMRDEAIWPILKKEFWLEESTVYRIVLKISKEADNAPNQLALPLETTDGTSEV